MCFALYVVGLFFLDAVVPINFWNSLLSVNFWIHVLAADKAAFWTKYQGLVDEHLPCSIGAPPRAGLPAYFSAYLSDIHVTADGTVVANAKDWGTAQDFIKTHQTHSGTHYAITKQRRKANCVERVLDCRMGGHAYWEVRIQSCRIHHARTVRV